MGGRIKLLRTQKGWTQEELGFRIGINKKSTICQYENDKRGVSLSVLPALAKELGTTTDYLLGCNSDGVQDVYLEQAIQLLNGLNTEVARKMALENIKVVVMMENQSI